MLKTLIFISFTFSISAEEVEFKPHMINHKFLGCPTNSYCKEELGTTRQKWKNALIGTEKERIKNLNKVKAKHGAPTSVFVTSDDPLKEDHILWDSPCERHKKSSPRIYIGETFYTKFPNNKDIKNVFLPFILIDVNGKYQKFTLPREDFPLFYENNAIFVNREEDANYYGVQIKSDGNYQIIAPIITELIPKKTDCDLELISNYKSQIKNDAIYTTYECRKIWDRKNEKFLNYIAGHTCHK